MKPVKASIASIKSTIPTPDSSLSLTRSGLVDGQKQNYRADDKQ
ncbi:MAG TPA: hypothetical protein VF172_01315 [Nitrososphaera sp.]